MLERAGAGGARTRVSFVVFLALLAAGACSRSSTPGELVEDPLEGGFGGGVSMTDDDSRRGVALNVRCFDYGADVLCFGTPGADNWSVVWPSCVLDAYLSDALLEPAGAPAEESCGSLSGAPDSLAGWDEVMCWRGTTSTVLMCLGRLGDHWMEIFADCIWSSPSLVGYAGEPAELFCGEASPDRGGWDDLRCFDVLGDPALPRCYGRRGAYWVGPAAAAHYANGLFGTCELDSDGSLVEVAPEEVCACEGACP